MTTLLLTVGLVALAMAGLGVGVLLHTGKPLKRSCHGTSEQPGSCDVCQCEGDR